MRVHLKLSKVTIRKAVFKDIPLCLEVEASQEDNTFSEHDFHNSITDSDVIFLVAEEKGRVTGFILGFIVPTRRKEAMIHSTMVHRQYSRKGIGSLLVKTFAKSAFMQGVESIFAEVEEGPDKFYEKCGFRKVMVWHSMLLKK